jgi:hypothetical protein
MGQPGDGDEPVNAAKSYEISKRRVLEAYWHVRANRGAAGIDDESIEMFEADLSRNLYKLWNRMASGSYFPPPVKQVEIAKKSGHGKRVLGVPTVADRIAQQVVKMRIGWEPYDARVSRTVLRGALGETPEVHSPGACQKFCVLRRMVSDLRTDESVPV